MYSACHFSCIGDLILISKSKDLIIQTKEEISKQLKKIPRTAIARKSLSNNGILIQVNSDKQIIDIVSDNSNIIVLVIDNILEKCISQIQYIELYINIILKLYDKCDYDDLDYLLKIKNNSKCK